MVTVEIKQEVDYQLRLIEEANACKVLFAVEGGSRAWGFPSITSDYDIRFIYIKKPEHYLSVNIAKKTDCIHPAPFNNMDIDGWDINKALLLFHDSNPSLYEWLNSPIMYRSWLPFTNTIRDLMPDYYNQTKHVYHYLNMCRTHYVKYLEKDQVKLKKYLHTLRPLLAVKWMMQNRGPIPAEFLPLLDTIKDRPDIVKEINKLIKRKFSGDELDNKEHIEPIHLYLKEEIRTFDNIRPHSVKVSKGYEPLNFLFRSLLKQVWD